MNSFSLGKNRRHLEPGFLQSCDTRTTHLITGQLKHWLPSKMPALNYSFTHRIRHSCLYCTANGWLEDQKQQLLQWYQSFGKTVDQVHFSCRWLCWKV